MEKKRRRVVQESVTRRSKLDTGKKEEMFAVLIRNRRAFEAVRALLSGQHVRSISEGMGLVWDVVCKHYDKFGSLPQKGTLLAEVNNRLKDNPSYLENEEIGDLDSFVEYAFDDEEHGKNLAKSSAHCQVALDTCKQFLEEYLAESHRDAILREGTIPVDLVGELERTRDKLERVKALTSVDLGLPFPEGWDTRERVKLFPTGVPTFDEFLGGGWQAPECLLFMGTYGSCKTTTTVHGVCGSIDYVSKLFMEGQTPGGKRPVVVLVFTEGDKTEYRTRILSHMAKVPRKRLSQMDSVDSLSKSKRPGSSDETRYEIKEFKSQIARGMGFVSERRRVRRAVTICNQHLVIIDCTDSDGERRIGRGGIEEIGVVLTAYFRQHKDAYPVCVWIDHASALADRMMEGNEYTKNDAAVLRMLLRRMPRQIRDHIGKRFNCPVALMHQLSGEANQRGSTARFHHSDAAECKAIAEYVDFAIVTGPPDPSQFCKWECTKHRREPPTPERIVYVDGKFNQIIDRTDEYCVSDRRIMSKEEMSAYSDHEKLKRRVLGRKSRSVERIGPNDIAGAG
jgi:hypothetical protein